MILRVIVGKDILNLLSVNVPQSSRPWKEKEKYTAPASRVSWDIRVKLGLYKWMIWQDWREWKK